MSATKKMWSERLGSVIPFILAVIAYPFVKIGQGYLWLLDEIPEVTIIFSIFTCIAMFFAGLFYAVENRKMNLEAPKDAITSVSACEKKLVIDHLKGGSIVYNYDLKNFKSMCKDHDVSKKQLGYFEKE